MHFPIGRLGVVLSGVGVLACATGLASAGINISNGAARFTLQTSDAGAGPVYVVGYNQAIIFFAPPSGGDFTAVSATIPGGTVRPMTDNGLGDYFAQQSSADESGEATNQPVGVYTVTVEGGTLGDGSVSFVQPPISFPSILSLTNYSSLLAADPAADFLGGLTAFTVDPEWSLARTYIQLTDQTTNIGAFSTLLDPSESSFTIPAGTLTPGNTYQLRIQSESFKFFGVSDATGSLAEATAYANRVSITDITFTAVPAPSAAALLGFLGAAGARRRR